mgnify:CR=1 FL=1
MRQCQLAPGVALPHQIPLRLHFNAPAIKQAKFGGLVLLVTEREFRVRRLTPTFQGMTPTRILAGSAAISQAVPISARGSQSVTSSASGQRPTALERNETASCRCRGA